MGAGCVIFRDVTRHVHVSVGGYRRGGERSIQERQARAGGDGVTKISRNQFNRVYVAMAMVWVVAFAHARKMVS